MLSQELGDHRALIGDHLSTGRDRLDGRLGKGPGRDREDAALPQLVVGDLTGALDQPVVGERTSSAAGNAPAVSLPDSLS